MLSVTDRVNALGRHALPLVLLAAVLLSSCGHDEMKAAPVAPTVSLSVSPTTIVIGQSATLTWSATNAGTCTGGRCMVRQPARFRNDERDTHKRGNSKLHAHVRLAREQRLPGRRQYGTDVSDAQGRQCVYGHGHLFSNMAGNRVAPGTPTC